MPDRRPALHTHFGALVITSAFLGTLLAGTLWRLTAAHLIASGSPARVQVGRTMLFQY
jgi:hypothetical protein